MNAVVYYSNTGESRAIAEYVANKLSYDIFDMVIAEHSHYANLVIVFPVHCQNLPAVVKDFMNRATMERLIAFATYGQMAHGNVLYELQRDFSPPLIAAAYLPTKHAYIDEEYAIDYGKIDELLLKTDNPTLITLPRLFKNPFANFFPRLRSQLGVKIVRESSCISCGICNEECSHMAIDNGKINKRCIRCLRCVNTCPQKALSVHLALPMKRYLCKKKLQDTIIYI